MKRFILFFIVLGVQAVYSQSQPITVLSQKWTEKTESKWIKETDNFILGNADPTTSGVSKEKPEINKAQSAKKYFEYEIVIQNISKQKVIGVALDYVFRDSQGKTEKSRNEFILIKTINPNKKKTLFGRANNPPTMTVNAKDYEDETLKPKEAVEIKCIVFEDKTVWKHQGVNEKVCDDLMTQIKNRKK